MQLAKPIIWETIGQTTQFLQQINCSESKREFKKMKRQATDWEKYLQDIYNKGLLSKIYKEYLTQQLKKPNNLIKTWAKNLTDTSPKKTHRWQTTI